VAKESYFLDAKRLHASANVEHCEPSSSHRRPVSRMWTSPHRLACAQDGVYCVVLRRSAQAASETPILLANTRPKVETLPGRCERHGRAAVRAMVRRG
jgi:hypothetical protein